MPRIGRESGKLKFDWQTRSAGDGQTCDIGVDAVGKRGEDRLRIGRVAFVFRLRVATIAKGTGIDIALQGGGSEDFGQSSLSGALPELHLKEAVLCGDYALGEEKIVLVLGIDVSDAPAVA